MARRGLAALVTAGVAVAATMLTATPAQAGEVYPRPPEGSISLRGHGWGHGIGMSQYGAYGGALAGKSWQDIVRYYYSGVSLASISNPVIRVRIASLGSSIPAKPAAGLSISWDGTNPIRLRSIIKPGESAVTGWRMVPEPGNATKIRVEYLTPDYTTWQHFTTSPGSLAMFLNPDTGLVTTTRSWTSVVYRHQLRAARTVSGGGLVPVVALPMESYLRSVVPSEMPASWPAAAVSAQAVAARSFAEHHRRYAPLSMNWYDVYDDTRSQVFRGTKVGSTSYEYPQSDAAVAATAQTAAWYGSTVAFTQFSSSSGGWTSEGSQPYLKAKSDPWDAVSANPNHNWTATVSVGELEASYPSIGSYLQMRVTRRTGNGDMGGAVVEAVLEGTRGSVTVSGGSLRSSLDPDGSATTLKSNWFVPTNSVSASSFPRDVTSDRRADVLAVVASTGALRVYSSNGTGGWSGVKVPEASGWNGYAKALTAGTWDADAVSDVLVQGKDGTLYLRRGNGDGTFAAGVKIGAGWQMHNLVFPVGDFDGDGYTDLMARRASDGALVLYSGNRTGGFRGQRVVGGGWNVFSAVFSPGDFDGDGRRDELARTVAGELYLYPGNGAGGWQPRRLVGSKGWEAFTAVTSPGDFDGDGKADVLARTSSGLLYLYPGNGTGGWKTRRAVGNGWQVFSQLLP